MTLNRPVSGHISGLFNDWGMRLIPVDELTRYVAEGTGPLGQSHRPPGRRGRPRTVPARLSLEFVESTPRGRACRESPEDSIQTASRPDRAADNRGRRLSGPFYDEYSGFGSGLDARAELASSAYQRPRIRYYRRSLAPHRAGPASVPWAVSAR
jgi:hypothetical protein